MRSRRAGGAGLAAAPQYSVATENEGRIVIGPVCLARYVAVRSSSGDLLDSPCRSGRTLLRFAAIGVFGAWQAVADPVPLGSIAEIRAVPSWGQLEPHPIALEGVVTNVDAARDRLVLQDGSGAVALDLGGATIDAIPGQRVLLTARDSWPLLPDLPRYPDRPDRREWLPSFESVPTKQSGFYVARFRGFLHPPATGVYRFWIASDDSSVLLLGADNSPASRRVIARVMSYTRLRDWNRTAPQRSEDVFLEAGHSYYIEAVHQQAGGATHLSVAWEGPGISQDVIPGKFLSPWTTGPSVGSGAGAHASEIDPLPGSILREVWDDVTVDSPEELLAPRTFDSVLSVRDTSTKLLGRGRMPKPVLLWPGQALEAKDDFCWCELEGTVDFVARDGDRLMLELSDQGERVEAISMEWHQVAPRNLLGRRLRVVGVAEAVRNHGESPVVGRIWLSPSGPFLVTNQAPRLDLFRLTRISELIYGDPDAFRDTAVKLEGRVVRADDGLLTISDDGTFAAFASNDGVAWEPIGAPIEVAMPPRVYLGLAVNSRVPTKSSRAVFTHVEGLSSSPQRIDIGSPAGAGRMTITGDQYMVDGVGSDIWDIPDQFTFVCEPIEGAGSIAARLDSFVSADPSARAGVMIRESLSPDAQFVDLVSTKESKVQSTSMQWRWNRVGTSTRSVSDISRHASVPVWFKLERRFNSVPVIPSEGVACRPGDMVDVVGYLAMREGKPAIVDASVKLQLRDVTANSRRSSWRPLVEIARLSDGANKWDGLDYFRIRGVVTYCGDVLGRRYWAIQDQSAATLLSGRDPSDLFRVRPGNFVEVVSNPGWFQPTDALFADNLFVLGSGAMPTPIRHPAEDLLPKRGEGTWIELDGIVRSVSANGLMEVKSRGEIFTVAIAGAQSAQLREYIDAEVRARGVVAYPNERERLLLVPSTGDLEIATHPTADPFNGAVESTQAFTSEGLLNQSRHRTRLAGIVTYSDQGIVYLQDDFGGARVELETSSSLTLGASVEVAGFPDWGDDDGLVLRHASVQVKSGGPGVRPIMVSPDDAARGRHAFQLIRVRAVVARSLSTADGEPLELEANQRVFRVALPGLRSSIGDVPLGSLVEITGVNIKEAGLLQRLQNRNASLSILPLRLLLRSPADFVVLRKPSWWMLRRTLIAVSIITLVAVISLVWVHRLRQRVQQRTAELAATMDKLQKEARMSATLAERDRLAGEIHDSLEQGLNGLILHLESTASLDACPPEVRSKLKLACNMASFSRTEVQYAVWELQSPTLEGSELPMAVGKIVRHIAAESLQSAVKVEGEPRRLASVVEHHLLRIVQEALNNTVKHASARNVAITLSYEAAAIVLSVADDGCGFDPDQVRTGGLGHFGLRSLRSRVGKIRGTLEIISAPGKGATVRVSVPLGSS